MRIMDIFNNEKFIKNSLKYSELAVVFSSAFLLASMTFDITMLSVRIPDPLVTLVKIVLTFAVMIRIVVQAKEKLLWISIIAGVLYYLSWNFYYFQIVALLSVACVGISYRKILKTYLVGVGAVVIGTIVLALTGGVENLIYMKDGFLRSSMGIIFPTDFATIVLFLLLTLWVYWEELPDEACVFIPVFSAWVAWYLSRSYTSTLCSIAFMIVVLYRVFEKRVIEKNNRFLWLKKTADIVVVAMFPVLMLLMFVLMIGYAKGASFAYVANNLMSGRVKLSLDAFYENGISLFGHAFRQEGAGGSTYSALNYEFVDSSYPRILLFYGVVILLLVCALWIFLTIRAVRVDRRRLAFALAIIALHSLSEHHFIEPYYNVFLILPFSSMEPGTIKKPEDKKISAIQWGVEIACLAVAALLLPKTLSLFRMTVLENQSQGMLLMMAILMIASIAVLIRFCGSIVASIVSHIKVNNINIIAAVCSFLVLAFIIGLNIKSAQSVASKYYGLVENDRPILQKILDTESGRVYVNQLGELYAKEFNGISRSVFDGEDLARFANATVVVDEKMDSSIFINRGFLYTKISDAHAIYTNDEQIIKTLKEEGQQLTAFCTAENQLDLEDVARINALTLNEDGSVNLGGESHSLIFGEGDNPFDYDSNKTINLYAGKYTANYQLKIDPIPYKKDYPVCRIVIDAYAGEVNLRTITVYRSWFDENGELDAKVIFNSGNNPVVIFRCFMEEGQAAVLKGITWKRTPDYDKRPVYDANHDKIRDEYYDNTGTPVMNRNGFASCSYHYWDKVTVDEIRYFDLNYQPVNNKYGYAVLSRTFNIKRQKVKEEYFDTEGIPVKHIDGYEMRQWEYDQIGDAVILRFCDTQGNPVMTENGYAEIHRIYDKKHRIVEETYYGTDGQPVQMTDGYYGIKKVYSEETDTTPSELIYIDINCDPLTIDQGFSFIKYTYDRANNVVEKTFCDLNGNPVIRSDGYSSEKRIFDLAGNIMVYQFCNLDGEPVMTERDYAEIRRTYDENGFIVTESYYDDNGKQIELPEGYALIECENDPVGNIVLQRFYSLDGRLLNETDSDFRLALEEKREPDESDAV